MSLQKRSKASPTKSTDGLHRLEPLLVPNPDSRGPKAETPNPSPVGLKKSRRVAQELYLSIYLSIYLYTHTYIHTYIQL